MRCPFYLFIYNARGLATVWGGHPNSASARARRCVFALAKCSVCRRRIAMTLEISHLSADELNLIFDSLSPLEARAAACVCRRWQQLVSPSRRRLLAVTSAGNNKTIAAAWTTLAPYVQDTSRRPMALRRLGHTVTRMTTLPGRLSRIKRDCTLRCAWARGAALYGTAAAAAAPAAGRRKDVPRRLFLATAARRRRP